jgi:hypothetical protein
VSMTREIDVSLFITAGPSSCLSRTTTA